MKQKDVERFWSKVDKGGECWRWLGALSPFGYGVMQMARRNYGAHRLAHELCKGPIPEGQHVLHRCDNPWCVNPDHLALGTAADNIADKVAKQRQARGERTRHVKLTAAQVVAVRAEYGLGGVTQREIAGRYGVSRTAVGYILCGKSWKHV